MPQQHHSSDSQATLALPLRVGVAMIGGALVWLPWLLPQAWVTNESLFALAHLRNVPLLGILLLTAIIVGAATPQAERGYLRSTRFLASHTKQGWQRAVLAGCASGLLLCLFLYYRNMNGTLGDYNVIVNFLAWRTLDQGLWVIPNEFLTTATISLLWRAGWSLSPLFSPLSAYALTSSISGVAAFWLLWKLSQRASRRLAVRGLFVALALSGGYSQLFFGYAENYTLCALALLAFIVSASSTLHRRGSPAYAALYFGLATALHNSALSVAPALVFLVFYHYRNHPLASAMRGSVVSMILAVAPLLCQLAILAFLQHGQATISSPASISSHMLWHSQQTDPHFRYAFLGTTHLWAVMNQLIRTVLPSLLCVAIALPHKPLRRLALRDPFVVFLLAFTAGSALFALCIDPKLGPHCDWDLLSLPSWGYLVGGAWLTCHYLHVSQSVRKAAIIIVTVSLVLSGSWIRANARYASSEPPFDRVYVSTAGDLLALGKTHEASLALRAALAENPRNVHAHVLYAMLVRSLSEDLQVARFHLRKAFQIDRDLAEALLLQQLPAAQLEAAQKPNADLDLLAPTVEDR